MRASHAEHPTVIDIGTMMKCPERVFVATIINPAGGNEIMTAHVNYGGAQAHLEKLANLWQVALNELETNIIELPLKP